MIIINFRNSVDLTKNLYSYHPVRRTLREKPLSDEAVYPYDQTPNKLEQILGKPEAPIRNTRKQKRGHVKSLGEEVTDSASLDKNILLRTIDESNANLETGHTTIHQGDTKQLLTPKRQRQNLPQLDLRRRNSDPATKATISEHPSGNFLKIYGKYSTIQTLFLSMITDSLKFVSCFVFTRHSAVEILDNVN